MTREQFGITLKVLAVLVPLIITIVIIKNIVTKPLPSKSITLQNPSELVDPFSSYYNKDYTPIFYIYQRLIEDDPNLPGFQPTASLAKRWEISDDGLTIEFWLDKSRFSSRSFLKGKKVKAEDVAYSLNRVIYSDSLNTENFGLQYIDSIETKGNKRIVINLNKRWQDIFPFLASGYASIVPINSELGSSRGSGPYQIDTISEDKVVLKINKSSKLNQPYSVINYSNGLGTKPLGEYCYYLLINMENEVLGRSTGKELRELLSICLDRDSVIQYDNYTTLYSIIANDTIKYTNSAVNDLNSYEEIWLDLLLPGSSREQFNRFENIFTNLDQYKIGYQLLPVSQSEWIECVEEGNYQMTIIGWKNPFPFSYSIIEWEYNRIGLGLNDYLWQDDYLESATNEIIKIKSIIPIYVK